MINSSTLQIALIAEGLNSSISHTHFLACLLDSRFKVVAGCFSKNHKINLTTVKKWEINKKRIYSGREKLIKEEKNL